MAKLITLRDVYKIYGEGLESEVRALDGVSLEDGSSATVVYVSGDRPDNALDGVMADEQIPDGFWAVPVEIGISDNYNVEIKSGVEEGTEVFTQIQTTEAWG